MVSHVQRTYAHTSMIGVQQSTNQKKKNKKTKEKKKRGGKINTSYNFSLNNLFAKPHYNMVFQLINYW